MKVEIIAVGTEMLMGQIINTNAPFLARELNEMGFDHYVETVVGDNPERLTAVTKIAEARSDILIYSGGIGPTRDDLTKQTIAEHLHEPLEYDEETLADIAADMEHLGREMTDNQKREALTFTHGVTFANPTGQAIGTGITKNGHTYIFLPGFPDELEPMFREGVKPYLLQQFGSGEALTSRYYNFFGLGESKVAKLLDDLIEAQTNPTLATYADKQVVTVRSTARAKTEAERNALLDAMESQLMARAGDYFYGEGWKRTPAEVLLERLKARGLTIGFAESLTAGLAADALASLPGASEVLRGSLVCYDAGVKHAVCGVSQETLGADGMVSAACAEEMAAGALERLDTDIAVSFTGVAGPTEMEGKPVGTVFIGFATKDSTPTSRQLSLYGNRQYIRKRSVYHAFVDLLRAEHKHA